jgi:hypothetical protein
MCIHLKNGCAQQPQFYVMHSEQKLLFYISRDVVLLEPLPPFLDNPFPFVFSLSANMTFALAAVSGQHCA